MFTIRRPIIASTELGVMDDACVHSYPTLWHVYRAVAIRFQPLCDKQIEVISALCGSRLWVGCLTRFSIWCRSAWSYSAIKNTHTSSHADLHNDSYTSTKRTVQSLFLLYKLASRWPFLMFPAAERCCTFGISFHSQYYSMFWHDEHPVLHVKLWVFLSVRRCLVTCEDV